MANKSNFNHRFTCPKCGRTFQINELERLKGLGKDIGESVGKTAINVSLRAAGLAVGSCFSLFGRSFAGKGFKAGGKLAEELGCDLEGVNCEKLFINCKYCNHQFFAIL